MLKHHRETLANAVARLRKDPKVLAVILGGSVAHGFQRRNSDIDLLIIVPEGEHRRRLRSGALTYWERESATYQDGYVDGKFLSLAFLRKVASHGSEPARFAFRDARVVFTRRRGIPRLLKRIVRYPEAEREDKRGRFLSQLEAWKWFYYEALKHHNEYLRQVAVTRLILFGCRLVLVQNRSLYPYHKWLLRVVEAQRRKPRGIPGLVARMLARPDPPAVERFYALIKRYAGSAKPDHTWGGRFMLDSELNWMDGHTPVEDL